MSTPNHRARLEPSSPTGTDYRSCTLRPAPHVTISSPFPAQPPAPLPFPPPPLCSTPRPPPQDEATSQGLGQAFTDASSAVDVDISTDTRRARLLKRLTRLLAGVRLAAPLGAMRSRTLWLLLGMMVAHGGGGSSGEGGLQGGDTQGG